MPLGSDFCGLENGIASVEILFTHKLSYEPNQEILPIHTVDISQIQFQDHIIKV